VASTDFVHGAGRIYLDDSTYSATTQAGVVIAKSDAVRIVGVKNTEFIVTKIES